MPQDKNKKIDMGGVKLVMFEYADKQTGEKSDFKVTMEELVKLNGGIGDDSEKLAKRDALLLSTADLNGDGAIDKSEFAKLALAIREKMPIRFKTALNGRMGERYPALGNENEFTLADAANALAYPTNGATVTIEDVRAQTSVGVPVTSRSKPR